MSCDCRHFEWHWFFSVATIHTIIHQLQFVRSLNISSYETFKVSFHAMLSLVDEKLKIDLIESIISATSDWWSQKITPFCSWFIWEFWIICCGVLNWTNSGKIFPIKKPCKIKDKKHLNRSLNKHADKLRYFAPMCAAPLTKGFVLFCWVSLAFVHTSFIIIVSTLMRRTHIHV